MEIGVEVVTMLKFKILTVPKKENRFVELNNRNSAVGIVTRLRAGRSGVPIPVRGRSFSFIRKVWTGSGAQLATYPMGTVVICWGKAAVGKVIHSPSAQIKKSWSYTSNPPIYHHNVERDNSASVTLLYRLSSKFHTMQLRGAVGMSFARPTFLCRRTESKVSLEEGSVYVPNCKSFFLLQRLQGSMSGDARDVNNIEMRTAIKCFSCKARR